MTSTPFRRERSLGFRRESLPAPADYYTRELPELRHRTRQVWAQARCVFHKDRNPSLSVNLLSGGFRCFGCGAHGGDVLAFHMLRHGLEFKTAARELGAWE